MSTEPAERSLLGDILTGVAILALLVTLAVCTRLAEVNLYGDWECFSKRCVVVPDGDGDASNIP